jgi:hypothetical protein
LTDDVLLLQNLKVPVALFLHDLDLPDKLHIRVDSDPKHRAFPVFKVKILLNFIVQFLLLIFREAKLPAIRVA